MKRTLALLAVAATLAFAGAAQAGAIHAKSQATPHKPTLNFHAVRDVKKGKIVSAKGFPVYTIHSKSFHKKLRLVRHVKPVKHKPVKLPKHKNPGGHTEVPEPTSLALIGAGLLALAAARRRRKAIAQD